jgi:hypothetical protein
MTTITSNPTTAVPFINPTTAAPFIAQVTAQIGVVGDYGSCGLDYCPSADISPIAASSVAAQMTSWLPLSRGQGNASQSANSAPSYILSLGDQVYANSTYSGPALYSAAVTDLYGSYIDLSNVPSTFNTKNVTGANGMYFFPVIGDHDWWCQENSWHQESTGYTVYLMNGSDNYQDMFSGLSLSNNPFTGEAQGNPPYTNQTLPINCIRYYNICPSATDVNLFTLSNDPNEQALGTLRLMYGNAAISQDPWKNAPVDMTSPQIVWFQNRLAGAALAQADAVANGNAVPWNIVMMHQPPFTSSQPGNPYYGHYSTSYSQFIDIVANNSQAEIDLVLSGHVHAYQRLHGCDSTQSLIPYIVNGVGGSPELPASFPPIGTTITPPPGTQYTGPAPASVQAQATGIYGFQILLVSPTILSVQFWGGNISSSATSFSGPWGLLDHLAILRDGQTVSAIDLTYVNGLQVKAPPTGGSSNLTIQMNGESVPLNLNFYMNGTLSVGGGGTLTINPAQGPCSQVENFPVTGAEYNTSPSPNSRPPTINILDSSTTLVMGGLSYTLDTQTGETVSSSVTNS